MLEAFLCLGINQAILLLTGSFFALNVFIILTLSSLSHRVLITSEEQFKLFLLPQLKPCGKYKLTAHEGIRVRRVKSATFASTRDPEYTENCLVYLANSGEIGVLSLPELRRQARVFPFVFSSFQSMIH